MNEAMYQKFQESCKRLRLDFSMEELSALATENNYSEDTLTAIMQIFEHLGEKRDRRRFERFCG